MHITYSVNCPFNSGFDARVLLVYFWQELFELRYLFFSAKSFNVYKNIVNCSICRVPEPWGCICFIPLVIQFLN